MDYLLPDPMTTSPDQAPGQNQPALGPPQKLLSAQGQVPLSLNAIPESKLTPAQVQMHLLMLLVHQLESIQKVLVLQVQGQELLLV